MKKIVIFIILLVVVIIGFIGFWLYRNTIFSKEILKLEILGLDKVKMGEEIEYTVKYKNNGNFVLENPKIVFELPDNSLTEDGKTRFTKDLDDIYPGDESFIKFSGRLLGKEGDLKVAKASLSYLPRNLSARYESDTTFTTKIDSTPLTFTYDLPLKVEKGKEINYSLNYFSNIDYPLENVSIRIDSGTDFNITSVEPDSLDNTEWKIGTLNKGQGGRLKIKGIVLAERDRIINFSAKLGLWRDGSFIVIKEVSQEVQVVQPLLFISQQINGSSNYIASPGETLNYQIFIRNIGFTPFDNLFLVSLLEGSAFDFSTLKSNQGQVKPNDSLVVFDSKQIDDLQHLLPQEEVKVSFNIKLKDNWVPSTTDQSNNILKNRVNVLDIFEEFDTKVSSKIEIFQKAYRSNFDGIENSGPIPPKVNQTTTYTINWQIKNYLNNVKNLKVKVVLPLGLTLGDVIVPEDQAAYFSFDSFSREIVWLAGNLASGAQTSLSFQVALTPNNSQKGTVVKLIGPATVLAEDQFTSTVSQNTARALDTSLVSDQNNSGDGIIQ